jgi:hypothetical protein
MIRSKASQSFNVADSKCEELVPEAHTYLIYAELVNYL